MKKMKQTVSIALLLLCFAPGVTHAQSFFSNFFSQKKAMLKNAAQQITLLKTYATALKKGYDIAHSGLTTIGDIKNGDFHLHLDHFNSLLSVNANISKYNRVADIIALEAQTISAAKNVKLLASSSIFGDEEQEYATRVANRLLQGVTEALNDLLSIVTSGEFEMTDDERINRIDQLYEDMLDSYKFSQHFKVDVSGIRDTRLREMREIEDLRILDGLSY